MTTSEKLAQLAAELELAAYQRGYRDGLRAASTSIQKLMSADAESELPAETSDSGREKPRIRLRMRKGSDQYRVLDFIEKNPGLRGVQIVERLSASKSDEEPIEERTVRTALHRLKQHGMIVQQENAWYPANSQEEAETE